jgi:predicted HicB family RNase H-like nuclease
MGDLMEYQGYIGSGHYSDEDEAFYGKLEGIRDLVTFEATDVSGLNSAFRESVDDYIATCKQNGKDPDTLFKGTFA